VYLKSALIAIAALVEMEGMMQPVGITAGLEGVLVNSTICQVRSMEMSTALELATAGTQRAAPLERCPVLCIPKQRDK
jgi:hypothetical protein